MLLRPAIRGADASGTGTSVARIAEGVGFFGQGNGNITGFTNDGSAGAQRFVFHAEDTIEIGTECFLQSDQALIKKSIRSELVFLQFVAFEFSVVA